MTGLSKVDFKDTILAEIIDEQQISPFMATSALMNYIHEGIYFLNDVTKTSIDYDKDLNARSLLKSYVLYANHKRMAEWKELFQGEYISLQEQYYINPNIS